MATKDTHAAPAATSTEAGVIADLAVKAGALREPVTIELPGGKRSLFMPDGLRERDVTDPDRPLPAPAHIRQGVVLQTVDSLGDYVQAFKQNGTRMFADITSSSIHAQIDYHVESDGHATGVADRLFHSAVLKLPYSEEWKLWTGMSGKMMEQLEFARFLEENAVDIVAPTGAELLEVIGDLHAVRKVDFRKAVRTASDNENFEYTEETEARGRNGGSIEVPTKFKLNVPVYFGDPPTELFAFLRWRLDEGALKLGIQLHRAEHVRQAVFKQIVLAIAHRTDRPVVFGSIAAR